MTERYDVVVVGARCAGSVLAHDLARAGLSVALVDRAQFPSDTISTHLFESAGIATLARLGLLEELTAGGGAPFINFVDLRIGDLAIYQPSYRPPGAPGSILSVRRPVLDTALVRAAQEAGADVHTGTRVTGLVRTADRVSGVTVSSGTGHDSQLDAAAVVGADGMGSTVARLTGARRYHVLPNQRFCYWGYFEGATPPDPPEFLWHRFDDQLLFGFSCDAGLYVVAVLPPVTALPDWADDLDGAYAATVARSAPFAACVADARRVGPLRGMANYPTFFRESAGPGWALVGDAGHFKDPAAGVGIADAFRQAEHLATDLIAGLGGTAPLDDALAAWWKWRDADALDMYWFAADVGAAGPAPAVLVEFLRDLAASPDGIWDFLALFHHATTTADVFTPERLGAIAARLAGTPLGAQVTAELTAMTELAEERARLVAAPHFVDDAAPRNRSLARRAG